MSANKTSAWQPIEDHSGDDKEVIIAVLDSRGNIIEADRGCFEQDDPIEEWEEVDDGVKIKIFEEEGESRWLSNLGMMEYPTHFMEIEQ